MLRCRPNVSNISVCGDVDQGSKIGYSYLMGDASGLL